MRAIFISYRREDTEGQAGRLFDDLTHHFGDDAVFMDVATIDPGRDFRRAIDDHVASCGVLLAIIGKSWVTAKNESGARRLDDPLDFVRLEIAVALKRDIPVVPVLVQAARMPRVEDLPEDLKELAFRNGVELTHARWDSDVQVLLKALRPFVQTAQAPTSPRLPSKPSEQALVRKGSARTIIAVAVSVLVLAFGGYLWLRHSSNEVAREAAVSGAERVLAGNGGSASQGEAEAGKKDRVAEPEAVPSFRDWQGSWNLRWEFEGTWDGRTLNLNSHPSGITGNYEIGTLEGTFVGGDFSRVTGTITNTSNTGTDCPSGKQEGLFSLTLSSGGTAMDGWWDVCGKGTKYAWKANRISAQ